MMTTEINTSAVVHPNGKNTFPTPASRVDSSCQLVWSWLEAEFIDTEAGYLAEQYGDNDSFQEPRRAYPTMSYHALRHSLTAGGRSPKSTSENLHVSNLAFMRLLAPAYFERFSRTGDDGKGLMVQITDETLPDTADLPEELDDFVAKYGGEGAEATVVAALKLAVAIVVQGRSGDCVVEPGSREFPQIWETRVDHAGGW